MSLHPGLDNESCFLHPLFEDLMLVPNRCKVKKLNAYQCSQICGIEVSSALVVKCLDPKKGEKILDICCSPGAKLAYISDLIFSKIDELESKDKLTTLIVGNDINSDRLNICSSLLKKLGHSQVSLVCKDGVLLTTDDVIKEIRSQYLREDNLVRKKLKVDPKVP